MRVALAETERKSAMNCYALEPTQYEDDFDWMATLAAAGIHSEERDLSHLAPADICALLEAEQEAAIALARAAGLPQEHDLFNCGQPGGLSDEMQRRLLETVNGLAVPKDAFTRVMLIVDLVPEELKVGGPTCAYTVIEAAEVHGLTDPGAPLALLARSIALRRWRAEHDPQGKADKQTQIEAGALARVIVIDGMPAFDGPAFNQLLDFITDLPF